MRIARRRMPEQKGNAMVAKPRQLAAAFTALAVSFLLALAPAISWADVSPASPNTAGIPITAAATGANATDAELSAAAATAATTTTESDSAASDQEDSTLATATAATATATGQSPIAIIHTNDVHCGVDQATDKNGTATTIGYAGVAAAVKAAKRTYGNGNVTLVDAGDAVQGKPIGTLSQGSYLIDIMNQVGYNLATLGNHEFDYGMAQLGLLTKSANFPYVSCNFIDLHTNQPVYDAYRIIDYNGTKVAYVGITTPESLTKSSPAHFKDGQGNYLYGFCQDDTGQALYGCVQNAVDSARNDGADYVIAVGHLGESSVAERWQSSAVIARTSGIDAFIDGHSHEAYEKTIDNKDGKAVPLAQTGTQLQSYGMLVIDPATHTVTASLEHPPAVQDDDTAAYIATIESKLSQTLDQKVATSQVKLVAYNTDMSWAVRARETNLGDLVADSYRTALGADIGLANGGGIRSDILEGTVTYGDAIAVQPFANELCMVEASGQTILDALEMGARLYPQSNAGFLQVSGLTYELREDLSSPVQLDANGNFIGINGPRRVQNVQVSGQPIDLERTYTVASIPYLLKEGGDGFVMFRNSTPIVDEGMLDYEALISFAQSDLGGTIGEGYANENGSGRIIVKNAADPEPQPVPTPTPTGEQPTYSQASATGAGALARTGDGAALPAAAASALVLSALAAFVAHTRTAERGKAAR